MSEALGLDGEKGREWSIRGACATKGEGLEDGLDWYARLTHLWYNRGTETKLSSFFRLVNVIQGK